MSNHFATMQKVQLDSKERVDQKKCLPSTTVALFYRCYDGGKFIYSLMILWRLKLSFYVKFEVADSRALLPTWKWFKVHCLRSTATLTWSTTLWRCGEGTKSSLSCISAAIEMRGNLGAIISKIQTAMTLLRELPDVLPVDPNRALGSLTNNKS